METNSDVPNRLFNSNAITNGAIRTPSNERNNFIQIPLSLDTSYLSNRDNGGLQERNASSQQNNFTNLLESEPDNELEIYLSAVCLLPVKVYSGDNYLIFTRKNNGLNSHLPTENSEITPTLQQNIINNLPLDKAQAITTSLRSTKIPLNRLHNQENDILLTERLTSLSTDADIAFSSNLQSLPLTDSGIGDDISSSLNNTSFFLSSSFEELTTFPIADAPPDCVWGSSNTALNRSSLQFCGNDSFEELFLGDELPTCSSLNKNYSNQYNCITQATEDTNNNKNDSALHMPNANNQTYNNGAVAKQLNYKFANLFGVKSNYQDVTPSYCKFCYNNKEPAYLYRSHQLKSDKGIVTCPILRNYVCPICEVTGDFAHTVSYCPANCKNWWYNQIHSIENGTKHHNIGQIFSAPNTIQEPISSKTAEPYEQQLTVPSSTPNNNIRSQSPRITYDRFSCAFPNANIFKRKKKVCKFCFRNKKPDVVYNSHELRDDTGKIKCPFLRRFVCRICGATGDNAHTRKYCPENSYDEFIQKFMEQ